VAGDGRTTRRSYQAGTCRRADTRARDRPRNASITAPSRVAGFAGRRDHAVRDSPATRQAWLTESWCSVTRIARTWRLAAGRCACLFARRDGPDAGLRMNRGHDIFLRSPDS
jgi:hypothetical protein